MLIHQYPAGMEPKPPRPTVLPTALAAYAEECLAIGEDIQVEYRRVGADMGYWAAQAGDAEQAYHNAKAALKREEAHAYLNARADAELTKMGGKVTEAYINSLAETDPRLLGANDALSHAARRRREIQDIVDGIKAKRDMLISLGADLRAELNNLSPTIKERP